ncbi:hypothetical protein [Streptomyces pratensis]|jgi:hypothetical protein|uniref:hypothetical protein n=1 Tax=Streptomyces pratensis TaxID=1169025 RepID=UPI00363BC398
MTYLVDLSVRGVGRQTETAKVPAEADRDGPVPVARPGEVVARAMRSPGQTVAAVGPVAQYLVDGFRGVSGKPGGVAIGFGPAQSAEAGTVLAGTCAQAADPKVSLVRHGLVTAPAGARTVEGAP